MTQNLGQKKRKIKKNKKREREKHGKITQKSTLNEEKCTKMTKKHPKCTNM